MGVHNEYTHRHTDRQTHTQAQVAYYLDVNTFISGEMLKVTVKTRNYNFLKPKTWSAGTDNDVHLILRGPEGNNTLNLDTPGDDFEKGNTDVFFFKNGTYCDMGDRVCLKDRVLQVEELCLTG